jgi:hypothetical protein
MTVIVAAPHYLTQFLRSVNASKKQLQRKLVGFIDSILDHRDLLPKI